MKFAPILLIFSLSAPAWAANSLDTPVERTPCTPIALPNGGTACAPPKVSQALPCMWVTIREKGKRDRRVPVCSKRKQPKAEQPKAEQPKAEQPKSVRGY